MVGEAHEAERARLQERIDELQAEIEGINAFMPELRKQVKAEAAAPPDPEQARTHLVVLEAQVEQSEREVAAAKAAAKQRKREIDEWKLWYSARSATDDAERAHRRLDREIAWRATEIAEVEQQIGELEARRWAAQGERELIESTLASRPHIAPGTKVNDDQRIVAAKNAKAWARERLAETKAQLAALNGGRS